MDLRRGALAFGMTASLLAGCAKTPEIKFDDGPSTTETHVEQVHVDPTTTTVDPAKQQIVHTQDLKKGCIVPTQSDFDAVKALFAQPTNPEARKPDNFAWRQSVAQMLGLHIVNAADYDPRIDKTSAAELSQIPFSTYFDLATNFFKEYNLNLDLASTYLYDGARKPMPEELEVDNAKRTLLNIEASWAQLPTDIVKPIGMHRLTLARFDKVFSGSDGALFGGYVLPNPISGLPQQMVLEINKPEDPGYSFPPEVYAKKTREDTLHEHMHMEDEAYGCGPSNFKFDPAYDALNPVHPTYSKQYKLLGRENEYVLPLPTGEMSLEDLGDRNNDPRFNGQVIFMRKYSAGSIEEDKGTLGPVIYNGNELAKMLNKGGKWPVLQRKTELLAAREYVIAPKYVTWLAATSIHD